MNSPKQSEGPDSGVVLTWTVVAAIAGLIAASLSGKFGPGVQRATDNMFFLSAELRNK